MVVFIDLGLTYSPVNSTNLSCSNEVTLTNTQDTTNLNQAQQNGTIMKKHYHSDMHLQEILMKLKLKKYILQT